LGGESNPIVFQLYEFVARTVNVQFGAVLLTVSCHDYLPVQAFRLKLAGMFNLPIDAVVLMERGPLNDNAIMKEVGGALRMEAKGYFTLLFNVDGRGSNYVFPDSAVVLDLVSLRQYRQFMKGEPLTEFGVQQRVGGFLDANDQLKKYAMAGLTCVKGAPLDQTPIQVQFRFESGAVMQVKLPRGASLAFAKFYVSGQTRVALDRLTFWDNRRQLSQSEMALPVSTAPINVRAPRISIYLYYDSPGRTRKMEVCMTDRLYDIKWKCSKIWAVHPFVLHVSLSGRVLPDTTFAAAMGIVNDMTLQVKVLDRGVCTLYFRDDRLGLVPSSFWAGTGVTMREFLHMFGEDPNQIELQVNGVRLDPNEPADSQFWDPFQPITIVKKPPAQMNRLAPNSPAFHVAVGGVAGPAPAGVAYVPPGSGDQPAGALGYPEITDLLVYPPAGAVPYPLAGGAGHDIRRAGPIAHHPDEIGGYHTPAVSDPSYRLRIMFDVGQPMQILDVNAHTMVKDVVEFLRLQLKSSDVMIFCRGRQLGMDELILDVNPEAKEPFQAKTGTAATATSDENMLEFQSSTGETVKLELRKNATVWDAEAALAARCCAELDKIQLYACRAPVVDKSTKVWMLPRPVQFEIRGRHATDSPADVHGVGAKRDTPAWSPAPGIPPGAAPSAPQPASPAIKPDRHAGPSRAQPSAPPSFTPPDVRAGHLPPAGIPASVSRSGGPLASSRPPGPPPCTPSGDPLARNMTGVPKVEPAGGPRPDRHPDPKVPVSEWIKRFDNMIEISILGKGALGTVKLMEDAGTKERFAVKFFNEPDKTNPDFGAKFMREVEMMISLQHSCILRIVGYSLPTRRSPAHIGTVFAANGSLRSALDSHSLDDTGIVIVICGLVRGLQFLHSKNVMHRDLKPENILLDERNWPQIGDLGSSRLVDLNLTQTREPGTPLYMAPELYDEAEYTTAVDIFSFGLILYELLVGCRAFPPTIAPYVLMKKVMNGVRPEIPADVNETGKKMIKRCWNVDPDVRPLINEVAAAFEAIQFKLKPNVDTQRLSAFIRSLSQK
jgi:hypothetical protein